MHPVDELLLVLPTIYIQIFILGLSDRQSIFRYSLCDIVFVQVRARVMQQKLSAVSIEDGVALQHTWVSVSTRLSQKVEALVLPHM